MQQRYYDPEMGMFPSTDPVTPFSPGGGFNRYWYANANPYGFIDPDGRQAQTGQNCGEQSCPNPPQDNKPSRREQYEQRHREQTEALGGEVIVFDPPALPQGVVDAAAGFGDGVSSALTAGLYSTADAREDMGIGGGVNLDSNTYGVAKIAGQVQGSFTAGGVFAKGLAKLSNVQQLRWLNQNRYLRFGPGKPGPGMPKVDMMRIGPSPWNIATPIRAWWTHWRL